MPESVGRPVGCRLGLFWMVTVADVRSRMSLLTRLSEDMSGSMVKVTCRSPRGPGSSTVCQTGCRASVPSSFSIWTFWGLAHGGSSSETLVPGLSWSASVSPVIVRVVVTVNCTGQRTLGLGPRPSLMGLSFDHLFGCVQHDVGGVVVGDLYREMRAAFTACWGEGCRCRARS